MPPSKTLKRLVAATVAILISGGVSVASAVLVIFPIQWIYRHARGIPDSEDLSDDFGMGLIASVAALAFRVRVFALLSKILHQLLNDRLWKH